MLNCAKWAEETFRHCDFNEKRLTKRLINMATDLAATIGSTISSSCAGDNAKITAGYRFLRNPKACPTKIMEGVSLSVATQASNCKSEDLLCLEDTTTLSYKHSVADGLGYTSNSSEAKQKGLLVHTAILVSRESSKILGIIDQNRWSRDNSLYGKRASRSKRDYQEKESFKWACCSSNIAKRMGDQMYRVISVCDREADIFPYLDYKISNQQRFIVRAAQDRTLYDEQGDCISDAIVSAKELGRYKIHVEQRGGRKARDVELSLRSTKVELKNSKSQPYTESDTIQVNVVSAMEVDCKEGEKALSWVLLTSEHIDSYEEVLRIVRSYEKRWIIEEFHKCWKSGVGVEEIRMQSTLTLETMATILAPIAIRVMQLREKFVTNKLKKAKCTEVLSQDEFFILWRTVEKKKKVPKKIPGLEWAYKTIAKLGGWGDSKNTGRASWLTIWKGWVRLADRLEGYLLAKQFT